MTTKRPDGVEAGLHTADDGLFGPDSVTWRAMAHPATGVGAAAAAMVQMLYPPVMYVVDQASSFRERPELRAQRTSDYATTITYGDTDAAEAAGATLRRIHARCTAVHPDTGKSIAADDPHLLTWVHNALTWSLLRAWAAYGPQLSPAEQDEFVVEQEIAARLVGCDVGAVAHSVAELDAYMTAMEPRLAMTAPGIWFRSLMTDGGSKDGFGAAVGRVVVTQAAVGLMSDHHRSLWGFRWGPTRERVVGAATRVAFSSLESSLPVDVAIGRLRDHVDAHAFGSRRTRVVAPPGGAGPVGAPTVSGVGGPATEEGHRRARTA
jgi:uncharacterized protein (DUF2236 family)